MSARNGRAKLPNEVWTEIWQGLPLIDRINVTHVCQRWREIALGTPGVWCSLDFWFSFHSAKCACVECSIGSPKRLRSNARICDIFLPKSLHLPLLIQINDHDCDLGHISASALITLLATVLRPHASRILTLDLNLRNPSILPDLLERVNSFPTLTALMATTPFWFHSYSTPLANKVFTAPALRRLSLIGNWCSEYTAALHLPAVEILELYHTSRAAVKRVLDACPNVRSLDVWFPDESLYRERSDIEAFRVRVAQIPHVRLSNLCSRTIRTARLMYDCPDRPNYAYAFDSEPEELAVPIFNDVNDATFLSCAKPVDEVQASLAVTSPTRRRALIFRLEMTPGDMPCIWSSSFHGAQLKEIECRWDMWYLITPSMPSLPALEILRFTVTDDCDLVRPPIIGKDVRFPALRRVILQGDHPNDVVPTLWWDAVVTSLRVDTPPTSIVFDCINIGLDDDLSYDCSSSSSDCDSRNSDGGSSSSGSSSSSD
ncbi:hypothetical protein EXIGLDRAFT_770783 [Exidia glandulosa HHB12029]|uniref:F-box domain-containing protein n=1 Tax=Exidia glandulosa HHB12029 TaxID=1314781 RepID=A0A165GFT4_EXIGL|nr:hypothetical protein EXIGLDRAFT_770783 [Exidia glandulosa HHB12029]